MDNLIIPGLIITILGIVLRLTYKNSINYFFGYRTQRAMKNVNNWNVANKTSSVYIILSGVAGMLAAIFSYYILPKNFQFEFIGLIIFICLVISVYLTEKTLTLHEKRTGAPFD